MSVTLRRGSTRRPDWLGNTRIAITVPLPEHDPAVTIGEPMMTLVLTRQER